MAPGGGASAPSEILAIASPGSGRARAGQRTALPRSDHGAPRSDRRDGGRSRARWRSYLVGVVSAEMGRRSAIEQEALRAQAIVSRTFALRNLRRWQAQGFDAYATVADQVYGGAASETPEGRAAVEATRGQILTYGGAPIDAFFYLDVRRPHRRRHRGVPRGQPALPALGAGRGDPNGRRTAASRRATGGTRSGPARASGHLAAHPAAALPPGAVGAAAADVSEVRDVRVSQRTPSGRVGQLAIGLTRGVVLVDGPSVRSGAPAVDGRAPAEQSVQSDRHGGGRAGEPAGRGRCRCRPRRRVLSVGCRRALARRAGLPADPRRLLSRARCSSAFTEGGSA